MSKKIIKALIFVAGVLAVIGSIVFIVNKLKKKEDTFTTEEETSEEDSLDAGDVIDFSGLKFSRNYVDLR